MDSISSTSGIHPVQLPPSPVQTRATNSSAQPLPGAFPAPSAEPAVPPRPDAPPPRPRASLTQQARFSASPRVSSLATLALNRFLKEAGVGKANPIISESAEDLCKKLGIKVDDEFLGVINTSLDRQSINNLAKNESMSVRQLNINSAIAIGSGEKPRRAILAAAEILSKEAQGYTFKLAVSGNVSPENAVLALTKASQAQLSISHISKIFNSAISHPNEEVKLHTLNLLGSAIPNEGIGIGCRQRNLIIGAQSSQAAVRAKVAELLPALLSSSSEMNKQQVLRELNRWQTT